MTIHVKSERFKNGVGEFVGWRAHIASGRGIPTPAVNTGQRHCRGRIWQLRSMGPGQQHGKQEVAITYSGRRTDGGGGARRYRIL